jgi:nucleotide-binding universal stress UspA family protein
VVRLLLTIDPTDPTAIVVTQVSSRPWPQETSARVLTVIELAAAPEEELQATQGDIHLLRRKVEEKADRIVSQAVNQLIAAGIEANGAVKFGDPRKKIIDEAIEWSAEFVFVRPHSYINIIRELLGSVSKAVLRDAPCSVEIVRTMPERSQNHTGMRILIATDGSQFSIAAVNSVASRPWPDGSKARVVSVDEPVIFRPPREFDSPAAFDKLGSDDLTEAEEAARDAMMIVSGAGLETSAAVLGGYAKDSILDEAEKWRANLIVTGSHGRRGLERILLGSVSEAVALHANCSVEVIRSPVLLSRT